MMAVRRKAILPFCRFNGRFSYFAVVPFAVGANAAIFRAPKGGIQQIA
jgi:hypothetical protein